MAAFIKWNKRLLALAVLVLAYFMEFLQYINVVKLLGLKHNTFTRMVLGTTFTWEDIAAYTLGIAAVLTVEFALRKKVR